jgi:hypothetical protein
LVGWLAGLLVGWLVESPLVNETLAAHVLFNTANSDTAFSKAVAVGSVLLSQLLLDPRSFARPLLDLRSLASRC